VLLRPITAADADGMWETVHDPEGNDLTATTATFTREQIDAWCATRATQDDRLDLAVVDRATGEYAGEVVLNDHDPESDSANFRIALRGPAYYGRGLGSEATRLVVDHALRTMGLRRITLNVLARNPRAQRAYEKAGFRELGRHVDDGREWVEMAVDAARLEPDYPLVTERLLLRPLDRPSDVADMHAYRSIEEVCRFVPFSPVTLEEMAERFRNPERVRSRIDAEGQVLSLAIERRDTGAMVGDLVLFWHSVADGHAEVGYVLHPDHAGKGFATEATAALIDLAFAGGLPVHRVSARLDGRNTASAAVAHRLGMRHEATYVDGEWFKGEWTTLLVFGLLRDEWEAREHETL
jgi:RimJ/RimL family protein N-acetyltransferase